ncbi:polyprenyl synthetase family protein [Desulfotalea psychrophila]|uniref:Related to octaprenyl-diphosphate synthase n=1 Tax=Desulfotalea psychrophila (strain LSv54 / DSM 12343) TaxID=177439 RepID=Q6AMF3_DESPS|nr:polyprenyl synthetase family protein [Desulfotalea psychrophila]CAG36472.1 related to octaprenyl-diphosphate synthase [Desulfotalea psychrophila LSv54]
MTDSIELIQGIGREGMQVNRYIAEDIALLRGSMEPLLCDILEYGLLSGGKRIRPLLVLMAARLCGNNGLETYRLATGFEYLHAATLFHDDIIDHSDLRRGQESIAKKFGMEAAILAGDFLHTRAMIFVGEMVGAEGLRRFGKATSAMVDGEFLQLRNAQEYNISELDYYRAVMGKTGVLIAAACELGALYGGGSEAEIAALRSYGEKLGSAFQIVDDLLDYQGDTALTGKAVGNDLAEGKMTLPLILALSQAKKRGDTPAVCRVEKILADENLRAESFTEISAFIEKYNGFAEARDHAEADISFACQQLHIFKSRDIQDEMNLLVGLGHYILSRKK